MKVLYLNNYDTSFIQNQIIDLQKIGKIEAHFNIHLSYWVFFKYKKWDVKNVFSTTQHKSLTQQEKSLTLHCGLPKEFLMENEPFFIAKKLHRKFRKEKFDLIHAQNGFPSGMAAKLLSQKWGIPYIITSHGMDTNRCFTDSLEQANIRQFSPAVITKYREALMGADQVIGVSKAFAGLIKEVVPEANPIAIQNSYNSELFKLMDKDKVRKQLGISSQNLNLIFVGNLIKSKRHIDIVRALKIIDKKSVKLVLIGSGEERVSVQNEIQKLDLASQVTLIPSLPQQDLANWYNASDIVIFPSLKDSFGLSLVEAMACGCPAITTRTYGPIEIVQEAENGLFVDFKSPEQIADKVNYFMANPHLINSIGKRAAESVLQRYANKNQELLELYKRVIKEYEKE
ncbi:MAG: glycosyltransferase [Candidatus Cloacimonadales bacterium]